tara:strand:+ start:3040 stop:3414 length:375 start_codon:yes stop_codon:yes gene_type:complete
MIKLKTILKEGSPGFENRKFGDSLPTAKEIKLAYEAKKLKESDGVDQAFLDAKPVNEDGHTDVASAKRKLKLSIEDATQILENLESLQSEDSLPSWWMDKVTLASNYLNTTRDYLLNPDKQKND